MTLVLNSMTELSIDELFEIDGGTWSWREFAKSTIGGAVGGAVTGARLAGGQGALTGAGIGAIAGAATYVAVGWW